jgi:hypothetical protein
MLDTHKRSSANESALVGGSLKSSRVSYIEQRAVNRNVILGVITAPSRHLSVTESIALPPNQGSVMLNRSVPSFFYGKATSARPFCADCDAPMILSLLEQDKPGFELRTFACPMCAATESIVVRV